MERVGQHGGVLSFIAEWYDPTACMLKNFKLTFYSNDNSIDMYDLKYRRPFLRRTNVTNVNISDMFVGNTIMVCSRQLLLTDYADGFTRNVVSPKQEITVAIVTGDAINKIGEILSLITDEGFKITQCKMMLLHKTDVLNLQWGDGMFGSGERGPQTVVALELLREEAVSRWRQLARPSDPDTTKRGPTAPAANTQGQPPPGNNLGTMFTSRNVCYASPTPQEAARVSSVLFPKDGSTSVFSNTARFDPDTSCCCIIKPHAVSQGVIGQIISDIQQATFTISAIKMFHLEKRNAEEFYEVYKGVVAEYMLMVSQLCSGPCLVLEISSSGGGGGGPAPHSDPTIRPSPPAATTVQQRFRELVGPADPELCRQLRPGTLRARYGRDKVLNAVHCTDLPGDGLIEVEYFFKILDQ